MGDVGSKTTCLLKGKSAVSAHAETAARGAPGTRHHVMGRGSERTKLVPADTARADVVTRFAALYQGGHLVVYAWALMANHVRLLVRTGTRPLAQRLKRLLTSYVVKCNRQHTRDRPPLSGSL